LDRSGISAINITSLVQIKRKESRNRTSSRDTYALVGCIRLDALER